MRRWLTVVVAGTAVVLSSSVAQGQTSRTAAADGPRSYAGIVGESAFGNVTSQSFGLEGGFALTPRVVLFAEGGRVFDAAPSSVGEAAQIIATYLAGSHANVAYTVKEPVNFFAVGAKYMLPTGTKFVPYLLAGVGVAQVRPDVEFTVDGVSVTNSLAQFGVVLGSDLAGASTTAMMEIGAGVVYDISDRFYADLELRYNRVFTDAAIPFGRFGAGIGVRF
jgi:opacity protein-like surface antigen